MKIHVVGGGPAGLYFALLMKTLRINADVTVFERNAADATYGFGVVLADQGLQHLRAADEESCQRILNAMEMLSEQVIDHPDGRIVIDSSAQAGSISRLRLLEILQICCRERGVRLLFNHDCTDLAMHEGADLIVAADGVSSGLRSQFAKEFGTSISYLTNRFAWYGVKKAYDASALTFRNAFGGSFVAHYYRYSPEMSTFVIECDEKTWSTCGLDRMSDEERREFSERVFAPELEGQPLIGNRSIWRQFPVTKNDRWSYKNIVLLGDALRSVHFSIGSGTRLAMEDAAALYNAFQTHGETVAGALAQFEAIRRPTVEALTEAARKSYEWYEDFVEKMKLAPFDFAYDYMIRTERLTDQRMRERHPRFMADYDAYRKNSVSIG